MNYIYDILLDFNNELYDFFDWNEKDRIVHIRKIPIFKIFTNDYNKIKNNKVIIDDKFKEKIHNRTEIFESHKVKNIEYACLLCDGLEVMAILFNNNGLNVKCSSLLLDENDDVVEVADKMNECDIKFKVLHKKINHKFLTRLDISKINYIDKEIGKIKKNKELEKMKFLYYELFNEKNENMNFMINKIKKELINYKNNFYLKVYEFFKLTSLNK